MRTRRGAALLLTLLILAIVIVLTAQLSTSTRTSAVLSTHFTADVQNYHALRAAVNYAVMMLRTDKAKGVAEDTLHETWAEPYGEDRPLKIGEKGDCQVTFRVEDEERRLNARAITMKVREGDKEVEKPNPKAKERLDRLVALLGQAWDQFGQRVIDYQTKDSQGEYPEGHGPLLSFGELMMVSGMAPELLYGKGGSTPQEQGLTPFLTVWGSGAVNINTAPVEVLMCLDDKVTKPEADRIVAFRESKKQDQTYQSFAQVEKQFLMDTVGLVEATADALVEVAKNGGLGVAGTHFSVFARARTRGFESRARVVLKRDGQKVDVVFWDDDQRFTRMEEKR